MTLQQLRYVLCVAAKGSISEAAKSLFVAQPSLSNAIRDLENEINITIFHRTNKGVVVSSEGEEFLGYARQVLEQMSLLEEKYITGDGGRQVFTISTQHYSFAVEAFIDLIKEHGGEKYDFRIRETQTHEIIVDVAHLKSEIGVLYLNPDNESVIRQQLKAHELKFHHLFRAKPHVFVSIENPLAKQALVTLDQLERSKNIMVRDRATLFNLVIGLNGYTISSGVLSEELNGSGIVAVPLDSNDYMDIGYITHSKTLPSRLGSLYVEYLKSHLE